MPVTHHNNTVSIALCLCNPKEIYLKEQLNSIENQSVLPDEIIAFDDSSEPIGLHKVQEWADKTGIRCVSSHNRPPLGIVRNFSEAVSKTTGKYVFLCDQDDVWLPEKIEKSVYKIQTHEDGGNTPVLYHTDLELIDCTSKVIGSSFMKKQRIRGGEKNPIGLLMLHNVVTGCSSSMNRSLVDIALPFPEQAIVHDWWIAMVAAVTGKIVFDQEPLTQYRQHELNTIGLKPLYSTANAKRILQPSHIGKEFAKIVDQNLAFKSRFGNLLSPQMHEFLDNLPVGGRQLLKAAKIAGVKPQAWSRIIRFKLAALSANYKQYLTSAKCF